MLVGGVLVGVVYLRRQLKQPVPLFPVDLLRIPVFALSMCTSVASFAAQMLAYIALPFLMLDSYGRSPLQAGLLITAWPLAIVVVAPIVGRLIGRYPDGLLGGIGLGILATGLALLAALPAQPANADIVWRMALCGIGFGLFQSPNNHTIITTAPAQPFGRRHRHAGHRTADRADRRRGVAGHRLQFRKRPRWARTRHRIGSGSLLRGSGWRLQHAALAACARGRLTGRTRSGVR